MPGNNSEQPETLQIRKYQNRRYYDTTRSQHVTLEQIHNLIVEGHNVRIADSQTGEDITSKILMQILIEYEPVKLNLFSHELLTRAIRVNDRLLKEFVELYFRQAFEAFCTSRNQFEDMLREAHQLTSVFASPATWIRGLFPPWTQYSVPGPQQTSHSNEEADTGGNGGSGTVAEEIAALRREVSMLRDEQSNRRGRSRRGEKK